MRGTGAIEFTREVLPEFGVTAFGLVTHLGDPAVLIVALSLVYWGTDRRKAAFVIALGLGAFGLTVGLKEFFALPRPPAPVQVADYDGYGFPSGHALGSTVVWGGAALSLDWQGLRERLAAASGVVALVSVSRVVIGVHYAVDVVAGVAVGAVFLALAVRVTRRRADAAFGLAVVVASLAFASSGSHDAATVLGMSTGAFASWLAVERYENVATTGAGVAAVGLPVMAVARFVSTSVESVPAVIATNAVFAAVVICVPLAYGWSREVLMP